MRISSVATLASCMLFMLSTVGCQKPYACPSGEKDKSQLAAWAAMGLPTDKPGIVVCEASTQTFSAAIPSPPGTMESLKTFETRFKADGWVDSPLKGYQPRTDDISASRRYEKCGEPQNPLGERFIDCQGVLAMEISDLPANLVGKPYLLWVDHRPDLKSHHVLTGTGK